MVDAALPAQRRPAPRLRAAHTDTASAHLSTTHTGHLLHRRPVPSPTPPTGHVIGRLAGGRLNAAK